MQSEMKRIARDVAAHYGVPYERLVASRAQRSALSRGAIAVHARHEAIARIRGELGASYPVIGRFFSMHHTSVMAAAQKPEKRCATCLGPTVGMYCSAECRRADAACLQAREIAR